MGRNTVGYSEKQFRKDCFCEAPCFDWSLEPSFAKVFVNT
jgi:hypothetical protein